VISGARQVELSNGTPLQAKVNIPVKRSSEMWLNGGDLIGA
jgi:hypothetical protein